MKPNDFDSVRYELSNVPVQDVLSTVWMWEDTIYDTMHITFLGLFNLLKWE